MCLHNVDASIGWLLNSGIQNAAGKHAGGFNGWYDVDKKTYPFVYSEITGYGITSLLLANAIRKRTDFIERARSAASWILNTSMHQCGGVRARAYYGTGESMYCFENNMIFSFDTGMVLSGLVNLFSETKDVMYFDAAVKMGKFLISLQRDDGLFYAAYDATADRKIDNPEKWSSQSGSYHAKLAIGLIDLYKISGDAAFRRSAIDACAGALGFQQSNGRFITQRDEKSTHMHPHCYSAEGLAYTALAAGENRFLRASADAVAWVLDNQLENGGVPCKYIGGEFVKHERSDTLAQTLRLGAFLHYAGALGGYEKEMERLAKRLLCFQNAAGKHAGGFFYGTELDGTKRNHINSWCSMFALQGLFMRHQLENGVPVSLNLLI